MLPLQREWLQLTFKFFPEKGCKNDFLQIMAENNVNLFLREKTRKELPAYATVFLD